MRNNLRQALQLFFNKDARVGYHTLVDLVGDEKLDELEGLGILHIVECASEAECPRCDSKHVLTVHECDQSGPFVACPIQGERIFLSPEELGLYEFNTTRFLKLFLEALGADIDKIHFETGPDDNFWDLGNVTIDGLNRPLFFIRDPNKFSKAHSYLAQERCDSVLFFLANPQNDKRQYVTTVPVLETIEDITKDKIIISLEDQRTYLNQGVFYADESVIYLDEHMGLHTEDFVLLFNHVGKGQFRNSEKIGRQAASIIEYLYRISKTDNFSVCLQTLADKFASGWRQTVTNQKARLNGLCEKHGTKVIITLTDDEAYRLNPKLKTLNS